MKPRYLIGIDPGVKTGYAIYDRKDKKLTTVETRNIISAMQQTTWRLADEDGIELWFEDSRLRRWFGNTGREVLQGVGSVKRDSSIWETFCGYYCIKYKAIAPKDTTTKVKSDYFKKLTGWEGRTSEHSRDAGLLVFGG